MCRFALVFWAFGFRVSVAHKRLFDVGMIGFSEGPAATSDFIYLDNWGVYQ